MCESEIEWNEYPQNKPEPGDYLITLEEDGKRITRSDVFNGQFGHEILGFKVWAWAEYPEPYDDRVIPFVPGPDYAEFKSWDEMMKELDQKIEEEKKSHS